MNVYTSSIGAWYMLQLSVVDAINFWQWFYTNIPSLDHCFNISRSYAVPTSNEMKYLTWHRSVSSRSSSSRNPLGATSKDDIEDLSSNLFGSRYMNAGSHASTLDRLYAWERKLYDEIKVKCQTIVELPILTCCHILTLLLLCYGSCHFTYSFYSF